MLSICRWLKINVSLPQGGVDTLVKITYYKETNSFMKPVPPRMTVLGRITIDTPPDLQKATQAVPSASEVVWKLPEGRSAEFLTSDNHAFYIGKMFATTLLETLAKIIPFINFTADERFYTPEFLKSALEYMFGKVRPTSREKPCIVIIPDLSALINGVPPNGDKVLSAAEQKELIRKLALQLGYAAEDVTVLDAAEIPFHQRLFTTLWEHHAQNADTFLDNSLGNEADRIQLSPDSDSLAIASYLYRKVAQDPVFEKDFNSTIPRNKEQYEGEFQRLRNYGLLEIAIRLTDILHGRHIHGGAKRQQVYDKIICRILGQVREEKNKQKQSLEKKEIDYYIQNMPELTRLFSERQISAFYLDTNENVFFRKMERFYARVRLAVALALSVTIAGSLVETGRQSGLAEERKQKEMVTREIDKELKNYSFMGYGNWTRGVKEARDTFDQVIEDVRDVLRYRYDIPDDKLDQIKPTLQQFALRHKDDLLREYKYNHDNPIHLADLFVIENKVLCADLGIAQKMPYAYIVAKIEDPSIQKVDDPDLLFFRNPTYTYDIFEKKDGTNTQVGSVSSLSFSSIGKFDRKSLYPELFTVEYKGKKYLVGPLDDGKKEPFRPVYTTWAGKYGYTCLKDSIRVRSLMETFPLDQYFRTHSSASTLDIKVPASEVREILPLKDPFQEYNLEVGVYTFYPQNGGKKETVLVARAPGEDAFSTTRAEQAKEIYRKVKREADFGM